MSINFYQAKTKVPVENESVTERESGKNKIKNSHIKKFTKWSIFKGLGLRNCIPYLQE